MIALLLSGCIHLKEIEPGITLPEDHAPHPTAQTEWWHVHATLNDTLTGEELNLFAAFLTHRTDLDKIAFLPLGPNEIHLAYASLQTEEEILKADRLAIPDFISSYSNKEELNIRHGNWNIQWDQGVLLLNIKIEDKKIELKLIPTADPLLPGNEGLVEIPTGSAHLWVQMENMQVDATLTQKGQTSWLEGTGFYKHQWGRLYDPTLDGFEWISMDLSKDHSLVIATLIDGEVRGASGSKAWISNRKGEIVDLPATIIPTKYWESKRSKGKWPVEWDISAPGINIQVKTIHEDQELYCLPAPIHVGAARATGTYLGAKIDIPAFVEQTGASITPLRALFSSKKPE